MARDTSIWDVPKRYAMHSIFRGAYMCKRMVMGSRLIAALLVCWAVAAGQTGSSPYVRATRPDMLTHEELLTLSEKEIIDGALAARLKTLLTTAFVSNEAYYGGTTPKKPSLPGLGPSMRVVFWNIERGLNVDRIKLAFTDTEAFLESAGGASVADVPAVREQLAILQTADVVVLNEVDWGLKRTAYRAVVKELGEALKMNWAYGAEFVEVDPKILGTESFETVADEVERAKLREAVAVDRERLRALHGTAVLSRYPIASARLVPFSDPGYDWFRGEQNISRLESGKRKAAKLLGETLGREVRRGGRTNLLVSLDVPDVKEKTVTIAATHLENRADPAVRRRQMAELLTLLEGIPNPIVIAGDLNTTGSKGKPRTLAQTVLSSSFSTEGIAKRAIKYATGVGPVFSLSVSAYKSTRFQNDPTTPGVKPIAGNPEAALFDAVEAFRFDDGTRIDFRGDPDRSYSRRSGTLANSNERGAKGFVRTFQFDRNIGPKGWFKLDWIFVKAYAKAPRGPAQPYRFAPHGARTLTQLNYAPEERISDDSPITVDLPFEEPHEP